VAEYQLNLRDYWRVIRRRKGITIIVTALFALFTFFLAQLQRPTPIYEASASVKFERSTTLAGVLTEVVSVSAGDSMATQAAIVKSFPVLERVAKALGLIPARLSPGAVRESERYLQVLSELQQRITTEQQGTTNVIEITATAAQPRQAQQLANLVAEAYREDNIASRNRQVREARRFIEEQLQVVGSRLQASEEALKRLKEQRGFLSLADETTAVVSRLANLETELERARLLRDQLGAQVAALRAGGPAGRRPGEPGLPAAADGTLARLNTSLLDLQLERENLLITLMPNHPQVQEVDAKLQNVQAELLRELEGRVQTARGRVATLEAAIQGLRKAHANLPELALEVVRLQRDVKVNEDLFSLLKAKNQEAQIRESEQVIEVTIIRPATEPTRPKNPPQTATKTLVGTIIGLTLGIVLSFVVETLDTSIGTIEDVESFLEVPVLGLIPNIDVAREAEALAAAGASAEDVGLLETQKSLISFVAPKSTVAESFRALRTNVEFLGLERHLKSLLVTSSSLLEGKTTTALNLAITMAQSGKRVLLLEADLRRPAIHRVLGIPRSPGLSDCIIGNAQWPDAIRTVTDLMLGTVGLEKIITATGIDNLHILTSGEPPPNPSEFLNSARMASLLQGLREEYEYVVIDCAPVLPVTDAVVLAGKVDGTLLIYRVGIVARSGLRRAKSLLENVQGKVIGVVLTGLRAEVSPDFAEMEYYRYTYGPGAERQLPLSRGGTGGLRGRVAEMAGQLTRRLFRRG
jgi:uncharacterized protein involved in exopolysaccharide biosynthesis/Mrp family chromosome partitioning ATPase